MPSTRAVTAPSPVLDGASGTRDRGGPTGARHGAAGVTVGEAAKSGRSEPARAEPVRAPQSPMRPSAPPGPFAAVLALQRSAGNGAVSALVRSSVAARAVQRCPGGCPPGGCGQHGPEEEELHRSAEPGAHATGDAASGPTRLVQGVVRGGGSPLESGVRTEMEGHFGVSLDGVRVHTGAAAAVSARAVRAHAYTVGQHIVFSRGRYVPGSLGGRRLLAHEIAHTIQQRGARGSVQQLAIDPGGRSSAAEREADAAAERVLAGKSVAPLRHGQSAVQRFPVSNEPVGGCGVCSKEQYGPGWQKKVGQRAHGIVQAAIKARNVLVQPELPITQEGSRKFPRTPGVIKNKRDQENGRLDIALPTPTGFAIAEIKPSTQAGEEAGLRDLEFYERIIGKRYPGATVDRLLVSIAVPPIPFPDRLARRAKCRPQFLTAMMMQPGLIGYFCAPSFSELRPTCSCRKPKKKDDKKKGKKKAKKTGPKKKAPRKKPTAKKPKKPPKKPKTPKMKGSAKAYNLVLGLGIGSSGAGAGNIGVGISINSSGNAAGTIGASITYDSDGNAIAAVGASAAKGSSANAAAVAGVTAAEDSSSTVVAGASIGTAKGSDVIGAGVASKGSAENVQGVGVGVATSGDAKDVATVDPASGTATDEPRSDSGTPAGDVGPGTPGAQGTPDTKEEGAGDEPGAGGQGPVPEEAKAEAKRVEQMLANATPAQRKLLVELARRYPDHLLPVPNETFTRTWLNATSSIRDEHVAALADAGWAPGTDIDEAEFRRRVEQVTSGKMPAGEIWTAPTPPPPAVAPEDPTRTGAAPEDPTKKDPRKNDPKKEKKAPQLPPFKGLSTDTQQDVTDEDIRTALMKRAKSSDFSRIRGRFVVIADDDNPKEQKGVALFWHRKQKAAAVVVGKMKPDGKLEILEVSDGVTARGDVVPVPFAAGAVMNRVD